MFNRCCKLLTWRAAGVVNKCSNTFCRITLRRTGGGKEFGEMLDGQPARLTATWRRSEGQPARCVDRCPPLRGSTRNAHARSWAPHRACSGGWAASEIPFAASEGRAGHCYGLRPVPLLSELRYAHLSTRCGGCGWVVEVSTQCGDTIMLAPCVGMPGVALVTWRSSLLAALDSAWAFST